MKWFKHEDTATNAKIDMLIDEHGLLGHGFYFKHLELISSNIKEDNEKEWGYLPSVYTTEFLQTKFKLSSEQYKSLLSTCLKLNLFQLIDDKIYCEQILERGDDYLGRLTKKSKKKSTKKLRSKSVTTTHIEEEREEEENKKKNIYPQTPKGELFLFLEDFNKKFNKNYQSTRGRKDKFKKRREKYSLEQILQALDNLRKSKFHSGKNDRGWLADPDFLLRNDEQIDKWLNFTPPTDEEMGLRVLEL